MKQSAMAGRMRRMLMWIGIIVGGLLVLSIAALFVAGHVMFKPEPAPAGAKQGVVTSKDGTSIAYEKTGNGPVVVLVSSALADREATRRLARLLADRYTVINYDRRGRGSSGDTQRYTPQREVEDIEALIDQGGDTAFLFGSSSGAALALEAASHLNGRVKALFLYEPPFIVDASRPPITANLRRRVTELIASNRRDEAVKLFFVEAVGVPSFGVTIMRFAMPGWLKMVGMANTTLYDLVVLEGMQNGTPLPKNRWAANMPTVVMVGSSSEPFFHNGARALTEVLPHCEYKTLEGGTHGSVVLGPKPIAAAMTQFFAAQTH